MAYCLLHVGTVFLKYTFPIGITLGDWVSLLCPWIVMGTAFMVWDSTPASGEPAPVLVALLLGSALLYATGFGVNLAANAASRLLQATAPTQPAQLLYFLDEHLGHILWHLGILGVSTALLLGARGSVPAGLTSPVVLGAAGYAFAYFTEAVEGQTVALLLPYSLGIVGALGVHRQRPMVHQFLLLGHGLALAQFLLWYVWQGGFPQFSEVWGL